MKSVASYLMSIAFFVTSISCKVAPEPIDYGTDGCHFCSMTIVDQQHAAEFVTKKGKVYKFDSIECMMNQLKEEELSQIALFMVADYNDPGVLVDATHSTFLISNAIPSPMGGFLSAFSNKEEAVMAESGNPGELFSWNELQERFK
ncbi:MAG: nitrous oxide reductase accessory protein NosL [Flavobacteriaceae bacterium]